MSEESISIFRCSACGTDYPVIEDASKCCEAFGREIDVCCECGYELHSAHCSKRVPAFALSCSDGVVFEIPSNTPGLSAGGFQIDDAKAISYEAVIQDPDLMPLQFKQFAIANERNRPEPKLTFVWKIRIWIADHLSKWINRTFR